MHTFIFIYVREGNQLPLPLLPVLMAEQEDCGEHYIGSLLLVAFQTEICHRACT